MAAGVHLVGGFVFPSIHRIAKKPGDSHMATFNIFLTRGGRAALWPPCGPSYSLIAARLPRILDEHAEISDMCLPCDPSFFFAPTTDVSRHVAKPSVVLS